MIQKKFLEKVGPAFGPQYLNRGCHSCCEQRREARQTAASGIGGVLKLF
jgi:hypothetical protein